MLTFELFAQSPPYAHLNAIYMNYDMKDALNYVKDCAGLSDRVMEQWRKR
jgi:4-hydroxyphenylacetate 3-monooxygenase